jgi:membrane fusion protein (multidrug efflux system)
VSFSRTHRLLAVDGFAGWSLRAALWGGILLLWGAWFVLSRVSVFEVAERARLESSASVHPVDAPVSGRISTVKARLGDDVRAGDVLWELDPEHSRDELHEAEAQLRSQREQIASLQRSLATDEDLRRDEMRTAEQQVREGQARHAESEAGVALAATEAQRCEQLRVHGLTSDLDCLRLQTAARKAGSGEQALRTAVARQEADRDAQRQRARAREARLRQELATHQGDARALETRLATLRHEVEERIIRAPVAGRLGGVSDQQIGSVVAEGARLGDLVPASGARAVAYFPLSALGRLRPGQPARIRLEAFPWTQFGVLRGVVERVATEASEGRVRVELALLDGHGPAPPAEHGLVGTAEVEVERVSPLALVVRSAGGWLRNRARQAS